MKSKSVYIANNVLDSFSLWLSQLPGSAAKTLKSKTLKSRPFEVHYDVEIPVEGLACTSADVVSRST